METVEICAKICKSKCCKSTPPALTSEDFNRISKIQKDVKWFINIDEEDPKKKVVSKKEDKIRCFFLSNEGLCEIYNARPLDCELFPLFFKIDKINETEFLLRWYVWYCPLTESKGIDYLKDEASKKIQMILNNKPKLLFEYQNAMYASQGYKKKHFLHEERLKIIRSEE